MEQYFTIENTSGYKQQQLDEMNEIANSRISDSDDHHEIQTVCEQVQREFDNRD